MLFAFVTKGLEWRALVEKLGGCVNEKGGNVSGIGKN